MSETVLIVGAGKGLSASLGRKFYDQGMSIHLAARNIEKLEAVAGEVMQGFTSATPLKLMMSQICFLIWTVKLELQTL